MVNLDLLFKVTEVKLLDRPLESTIMHFLLPWLYRIHSVFTQTYIYLGVICSVESETTLIDLELGMARNLNENFVVFFQTKPDQTGHRKFIGVRHTMCV